jgi:apolipoprotein N-acyltransferase
LPPFDWGSCAWVALVPLLLALQGISAKSALAYGLLCGFTSAWLVGGWFAQAAARYLGMSMLLGALGGCAYAVGVWGVTFALFSVLYRRIADRRQPILTQFVVAALWVTTELIRGRVVGQPWALLGYTQHDLPALIQTASLTGVYGISFLVALGNAALMAGFGRIQTPHGLRAMTRLVSPALFLTLLAFVMGSAVLPHGSVGGFAAGHVVAVQTAVAPAYEWDRAYVERQLQAHIAETRHHTGSLPPRLIVWPEHAVPQYLESDPALAASLGELARRHNSDLLFGVPRFEDGRTFNSVRLITAGGRNGGYYDKQRLVPFAEKTPLVSPVRAQPMDSPREFSAGEASTVLRSFVNLGVSICHEALYPEIVSASVRAGAELLVNVSNDGWLDGGTGVASRQHFAMVVFRAVENRRYLVRAATTGVSGIIDPYGRVLTSLPPNVSGSAAAAVRGRADLTIYARLGDWFAIACVLVTVVAVSSRAPRFVPRRGTLASPAPGR